MRLKQIGKGLALAAGLLLSACTNDGEMEWQEGAPTSADSSMGTVTFQIAGLSSTSTLRADEGGSDPEEELYGIQTVGESEVQHLVAVLFKGEAGNQEIGEVTETNNEVFVKAMDVFVGSKAEIMKPGVDYSLPIDKEISYVVCFIANPSDALLQQINTLNPENGETGSTVRDLKLLVEERDPDMLPKMMTSNFYKVYLDPKKENVTLGEVKLTRSMARIDIVNNAQEVTITKIVVNNRIVKSRTMSDEPASPQSDWIEEDSKTYDTNGNEALSLRYGESYRANIYCYEVLSTADTRPTVDIYYTKGSENKKHTVEFKGTDGNAISIKRNTRYNIVVTSQNEPGLNVYLRVADWDEVIELSAGKGQIADGVVAPGDYLMKNGQFISSSSTLTQDQKDNVIGVVFYVTSDIEDTNLGADVKNYLRANPSHSSVHGKAISLKNYSPDSKWAISESSAFLQQYEDLAQAIQDMNGYGHSQSIWNLGSGRGYYAFDYAKAYQEENDYEGFVNTGWYLPSEGEFNLLNIQLTAVDNALVALGADRLYGATYWSSSEKEGAYAWTYGLPSLSILPTQWNSVYKQSENTLRFAIAF